MDFLRKSSVTPCDCFDYPSRPQFAQTIVPTTYSFFAVNAANSGPPGYKFIKFPATFVTVDLEDTCVSLDGLRVQYEVTFQYQAVADLMYDAVIKYRDFSKWNRVVRSAGSSAVQHTCSNFTISAFQNKRGDIQRLMEDNLRLKVEGEEGRGGVYARAVSLQLRNVELPVEYQGAVAEKQSAEEDIALAQNQRKQEVGPYIYRSTHFRNFHSTVAHAVLFAFRLNDARRLQR